MSKENLPLELLNKHRTELGLENPAVFEHENDLFAEYPTPTKNAVVFLPKSKALIDMTLALVSEIVVLDGTIILAGANDAGIRSAKDIYEKNIGPVEQKIVGNHSALYVGKNKKLNVGKTWKNFLSFSPVTYKNLSIDTVVLPGVFSAGELDAGTKLLLDNIPYDFASGQDKILDVGCGAGTIGAFYKKLSPKSDVTMSDSSMLAVKAAEETISKNRLAAKIVLSDVFSNVDGKFDLIITNPPFHKGVATDYSFIEKFAADARKYLAPNGQVYVVANAFLPYKEILGRHIGPTEIIADDKKFVVYKSIRKI